VKGRCDRPSLAPFAPVYELSTYQIFGPPTATVTVPVAVSPAWVLFATV
jgi:hypothetical protein